MKPPETRKPEPRVFEAVSFKEGHVLYTSQAFKRVRERIKNQEAADRLANVSFNEGSFGFTIPFAESRRPGWVERTKEYERLLMAIRH
jgi:hypothetical protein